MSRAKAYQFFRIVEAMRQKQVEYFKTRDPHALHESKVLERKIDSLIRQTNEMLKGMGQLSLNVTPPLQNFIVLGKNPDDGVKYAFSTDWYDYENHYDANQEMTVIDLYYLRVAFNGKDWEEIEEDHL